MGWGRVAEDEIEKLESRITQRRKKKENGLKAGRGMESWQIGGEGILTFSVSMLIVVIWRVIAHFFFGASGRDDFNTFMEQKLLEAKEIENNIIDNYDYEENDDAVEDDDNVDDI
ncbi:unnamed protein product [Enterobius vermicularis]|uniref:Transmembrane protein n=1 Tax=Enterobius vermicularis TaxID=51028 RepID=A0A0N4VP58_ENTVE|nr:unnamed protein product [Enterobius vermicularis]